MKRIIVYALGLLVLAFGVSFSLTSNLGVSPVTSVPYILSLATGMEIGNMTIIVFCVYVLIQFLIIRERFRWKDLLEVPCAILFGKFVTLTNLLLGVKPSTYGQQLLLMFSALICIGVGLQLYLAAQEIPQAADGLVQAISQRTGMKLANTKNLFDLASVAFSASVSYIATGHLNGLREGTLFLAFGVGRVLALVNKVTGRQLKVFLNKHLENSQ